MEQDNVVRCFACDVLMVEGQQHNFLVMDYVEGQTLRDLLIEWERVSSADGRPLTQSRSPVLAMGRGRRAGTASGVGPALRQALLAWLP